MPEQLAVLDHQIDAGDIHVNDAPGADVQVPDFAVAHLPVRQSDEAPAGVNQRVRILGEQLVIVRLARQRNGVGIRRRSITPAIEDDQNERFGLQHFRIRFQIFDQISIQLPIFGFRRSAERLGGASSM